MNEKELTDRLRSSSDLRALRPHVRELLYDGSKNTKLRLLSELSHLGATSFSDILAEIVQIEEDPSVRMATFASLCKLGNRSHFSILLEALQMEEIHMVQLVMRSNFNLFLMANEIDLDEIKLVDTTFSLSISDPFNCEHCGAKIWKYPCQICDRGEICSICYCEVEGLANRIQCNSCSRSFHRTHLSTWAKDNNGCPICKDPAVISKL